MSAHDEDSYRPAHWWNVPMGELLDWMRSRRQRTGDAMTMQELHARTATATIDHVAAHLAILCTRACQEAGVAPGSLRAEMTARSLDSHRTTVRVFAGVGGLHDESSAAASLDDHEQVWPAFRTAAYRAISAARLTAIRPSRSWSEIEYPPSLLSPSESTRIEDMLERQIGDAYDVTVALRRDQNQMTRRLGVTVTHRASGRSTTLQATMAEEALRQDRTRFSSLVIYEARHLVASCVASIERNIGNPVEVDGLSGVHYQRVNIVAGGGGGGSTGNDGTVGTHPIAVVAGGNSAGGTYTANGGSGGSSASGYGSGGSGSTSAFGFGAERAITRQAVDERERWHMATETPEYVAMSTTSTLQRRGQFQPGGPAYTTYEMPAVVMLAMRLAGHLGLDPDQVFLLVRRPGYTLTVQGTAAEVPPPEGLEFTYSAADWEVLREAADRLVGRAKADAAPRTRTLALGGLT